MPGVKKIYHKGKEILFIDYSGSPNESVMIEILKEAQKIIISDNKEYLQLVNIANAYVTPLYMKTVKEIAKDTPRLALKRAMVGISGKSRKILLMDYNLIIGKNGIKPFDTIEEAKDWLIE